MLTLLLLTLLQLNQVDYSSAIFQLDNKAKSQIIYSLMNNKYAPPFRIQRSLPPIPNSLLKKPSRIFSAQSAVVVDTGSGQILWEKNTDQILPIASLTKLMTAIVFLETDTDFQKEITIEQSDTSNIAGSRIVVQPGETFTVEDLFYASLVGSANNATRALARSTGLSEEEFVNRMNGKATDFGLTNTNFYEVTGLDPDNTSTVIEYSRVASYAFRNELIRDALNRREHEFRTIDQKKYYRISNTNKLLADSELSLIGAKTVYLHEAGNTFVSQAQEGGHNIMVVLLHSDSSDTRFAETKELFNWAFGNFTWY